MAERLKPSSLEIPKPRRRARTEQGRNIVESILTAAERLIAREGRIENLRTSEVADLAGVSIGSLYQYFPSNQAIVAELARRLEERGLTAAQTTASIALEGETSLEATVRALVGVLFSGELGDMRMRIALLRDVPPRWIEEVEAAADRATQGVIAGAIDSVSSEVRAVDSARLSFVALHAARGVVEAALLREPELLSDPAFIDEVCNLVVSYLRRSADPRK